MAHKNTKKHYKTNTVLAGSSSMDIKLLPYQAEIFFSEKKILGFIGGTGCGKSYMLPIWLWNQTLKHPNEEWIVSAPTIPMLKRNPIKYMLKFFNDNGVVYNYNKTDYIFEMPHATIHCISAQEPDRMQGIHAKGIVGDEAGLFDRLWWETAVQRTSFKKGQIFLTTTPYGFNWLKTEVYDRYQENPEDIELVNPTSKDNPFYPIEEYNKAKERLPDWKFKMLYEAKFTKPEGLIYPDYEVVERFEIPEEWETVIGLDFGWNDPTGILVMRIAPDGTEYVTEEVKMSKMTISQMVERLKYFGEYAPIEADPSDKQIIYTLKEDYHLNVNSANNNVFGGIMNVQEKVKKGQIKFFDDLVHTIDELETYTWDMQKDGESIKDAPKKRNDHLLDPLRYICTRKGQFYRVRSI